MRKRPQQKNIIGESKATAELLNLPSRIEKLRNKAAERKAALDELAAYRKRKALKKRKREEENDMKKKAKLEWKEKITEITPILIAAKITKPGKVCIVPQVRKYLIQEKKLARKDQKTITDTNVVEKWAELN